MSIFNFRNYDGLDRSFADYLEKNKAEFDVPGNIAFISGNDAVYDAFANDITKSYAVDVLIVLKYIKVLLYNGQ